MEMKKTVKDLFEDCCKKLGTEKATEMFDFLKLGYRAGFRDGYSDACEMIRVDYESGYEEGYDDGYDDCLDDYEIEDDDSYEEEEYDPCGSDCSACDRYCPHCKKCTLCDVMEDECDE